MAKLKVFKTTVNMIIFVCHVIGECYAEYVFW